MKTKDFICKVLDTATKVVLSTVLPAPISTAFNALIDNIKQNVLEERAEKWKFDVVSRLSKLECEYEDLIKNQTFATVLYKTTELAMKTEQDEKRQYLANALINSSKPNVEEDKVVVFLNLIEKYSILHIKVLAYFNNVYKKEEASGYGHNSIFFSLKQYLDYKNNDVFLKKIIKDLQNDFLIETFADNYTLPPFINYRLKIDIITKLGTEFYNFLCE